MSKVILPTLLCLFSAIVFAQSTGSVSGRVMDKLTNKALAGATVAIKGTNKSITTSMEGYFTFEVSNAGEIILVVSHIGYETVELKAGVVNNLTTIVNVTMSVVVKMGNEVIVSASKRPEKIINAPASVQVIGVKDLKHFAGSNVGELISKVQGVEYTRNGVAEINFNARGLNSAFNNKVLQIVDGRNSMTALSAGLPVMNRGTSIKEDIDRLEIVLGPQSALYGPNAHNAVFNTITKDPRSYPGTTVSVSAGTQSQFSSRIRQATKINNKWAFKLTGELAIGKEFDFKDSVYAGNQSGAQPFFGHPVAIPERNVDFNFRHIRGEGHLYYSVTPKADILISGGGSTNNWIQVTTAGRNQMRGVTYSFLQARFLHPRFFANLYNTWGSLGTSYIIPNYTRDYWNITHSLLESGPNRRLPSDSAEFYAFRNKLKEESRRINLELQYNYVFQKAKLFLVTSLNYQKEMPNGYGTTLIDSFEKIRITQYGALLQLDKLWPWGIRLIGAARFDNHENFGNFTSPKFALLKAIGDGNVRISWGRAYAMPSIQSQYAGIGRFLFGNGGGIQYIKTNTNYNNPTSISYTIPLKPEQVSTFELGYKGTIIKKLFIDINYYNGLSKGFLSPARLVSGRALAVNSIAVTHSFPTAGTIIRDTLRNASFSTFFNYGDVRTYGIDFGLDYTFNKFLNLAIRYSWFGSDITKNNLKNDANQDGYVSLEEKSMNAPKNRGAVILSLQNLCKEKLFINISARYMQEYDFYSASQIGTAAGRGTRGKVFGGFVNGQPRYYIKNFDWGPLGDFITIDLSVGYEYNKKISLNMGITNLFNTSQIEFVGSPSIGRLLIFEMRFHIPNGAKKY